MNQSEFIEKQNKVTNEFPVFVENLPKNHPFGKLQGKTLWANGSWIDPQSGDATAGVYFDSFDSEGATDEVQLARIKRVFREQKINKCELDFGSLQQALLSSGPRWRWPVEYGDAPDDGERALEKLKSIRNKHRRELRKIEKSSPYREWREQQDEALKIKQQRNDKLDKQARDRKRAERKRIEKISM